MDRTTAANYATVSGKRQFVDENLLSGIAGTELQQSDHNAWQEELMGLIEGSGLVGNAATLQQALQGVSRLARANYTAVTATQALTADASGVVKVDATAGNIVITLPAANAVDGKAFGHSFVRNDTSANTVTLQRAGTDTFNPGAQITYAMAVGEVITLAADGISAWYCLYTNMLGRRTTSFSASGSFTVPAFVQRVIVTLVGGGGGGSGCAGTTPGASLSSGGGGGAGGAAKGVYPLTPGSVIPVTVGLGGAAQATGGTSSFGSLISATGGSGTLFAVPSTSPGGAPGLGSGGNIFNIYGGYGIDGQAGSFTGMGNGGSSLFGGGARAANSNGAPGTAPGSGGGGSYGGSFSGGAGANGLVLVEY